MSPPQNIARPQGDPHTSLIVKHLGCVPYESALHAMRTFTAARKPSTMDEIWLLEHPPVYTTGVAGRAAHLPRDRDDIPLIRVDRGGQITYHGPGQLIAYVLLDLKRRGWSVRPLVRRVEQAVIDLLADYGIVAAGRTEAPGVYVNGAKVAALGLRITRGCCYHGLALNVDMDLSPFRAIDPCGYPDLAVTQLKDLAVFDTFDAVRDKLARHLQRILA